MEVVGDGLLGGRGKMVRKRKDEREVPTRVIIKETSRTVPRKGYPRTLRGILRENIGSNMTRH